MRHQDVNSYSPLRCYGTIEVNLNIGPEGDYPSIDRSIAAKDTGDLAEFLAEAFPDALLNAVKGVFDSFDPSAGGLDSSMRKEKWVLTLEE